MHDDEQKHTDTDEDTGYETRDVASPLVFWSLTGLAILTVTSAIFVFGFFVYLRSKPNWAAAPPSPFASERVLPPTPRLQANPPMELKEFNENMDKALNSYGWVDKSAGIAHIPVDVALDILAKRGLPYGAENQAPKPAATGEQAAAQTPASGSSATPADGQKQQ